MVRKFRLYLLSFLFLGAFLFGVSQAFSYFSDSVTSSNNTFIAGTWEDICELSDLDCILEKTLEALEENPIKLYPLLVSDLAKTFSQSEFLEALNQSSEEIEKVGIVSGATVTDQDGVWAEAEVEIFLLGGDSRNFLIVFHKEGEEWRIFGTQEL